MEGFYSHMLLYLQILRKLSASQEKKKSAAEQKSRMDSHPSAQATVSLSQSSDTPTKPATQKEDTDLYTPGAGAMLATAYEGSTARQLQLLHLVQGSRMCHIALTS